MRTRFASCVGSSLIALLAASCMAATNGGAPAAQIPSAPPMPAQSNYRVRGSSISIHLPPDMVGGEANGLPVVLNLKDPAVQFFFIAAPAAPEPATQPSAPDAAALSAQVKPLLFTVKPDSISPDSRPDYAYALHFKCLDCHNQPVAVIELGKVVGHQMLTGWTWYMDADPTAAKASDDAQGRALDEMMSDATTAARSHAAMPPPQMAQGSEDHSAEANHPPTHAPAPTTPAPSDSSSTESLSGAAQRDAWATAALAAAKKLQSSGNDADAYERYQYILHEYPKSAAAKDAQAAVTAYQANADLMAKINPAPATKPAAAAAVVDPATKAAGMLSMGENYLAAGQNDLARSKFQAIVDQFPDSSSAAAAKQHLSDMNNAGK